MGQWWSHGWIWLSLILLVVLYIAMAALGLRMLNEVRQGVGSAFVLRAAAPTRDVEYSRSWMRCSTARNPRRSP